MPKNLSAIKRTQISIRNRSRNKVYKSAIKTLAKKCLVSTQHEDFNSLQANSSLSAAYSKIDKAVKKGILHKNNAARKKALLAKNLKDAVQNTATNI